MLRAFYSRAYIYKKYLPFVIEKVMLLGIEEREVY